MTDGQENLDGTDPLDPKDGVKGLPEGLKYENGQITGTPKTEGEYKVTVTAEKDGKTTTREVTIKVVDEKRTDLSSKVDRNKCVPALLGAGLPLLALIPLGIDAQTAIPGLENLRAQLGSQVSNANTELQKQLGLLDPAMAAQAAHLNDQLRAAGSDLGQVAAGLALLAAGIGASALVATKCAPNNNNLKEEDMSPTSSKK